MKDQARVRREAAEWFVAIHGTQAPSEDQLDAWLRWIEGSKDNLRAFEHVAEIWHSITPAIIASGTDAGGDEEYDGSISIAEWRALNAVRAGSSAEADVREGVPDDARNFRAFAAVREAKIPPRIGAHSRNWLRPTIAVAASLACATLIVHEPSPPFGSAPVSDGHFETHTGEHMQLTLADGSIVTLGARSRVTVAITPTVRKVRLQAGEAYFSVKKDASRSFTVLALDGAITAVGTAFNVRALQDRVTVTVTEGVVRVDETASQSAEATVVQEPDMGTQESQPARRVSSLRLARGEQVTYQPENSSHIPRVALEAIAVKSVDPIESARWRDGWLIYRDEPLGYVIADVARYTDLKIVVAGSAADLQISGAIFRERIMEWIVALPDASPVVIERDGDRVIITSRPGETLVRG